MTICNHSRISSQITDPLCQKPATSLLRASRKWTFRKASTRYFMGRLAGELPSVGVVEGLVDGLASAAGSDDGLSKPQVSLDHHLNLRPRPTHLPIPPQHQLRATHQPISP